MEFLVLRGDERSTEQAIKSGLSSRIAQLLGREARTLRRYWRGVIEDSYQLRCDLVHEAKENESSLIKLVPLLSQATFEVIWFCIRSVGSVGADLLPSELLDVLANSARVQAAGTDEHANERSELTPDLS